MATNEEAGPKSHTDDCELVGALTPAHLNQHEVQLFEWARRDRAEAIRQLIDERRCDVNVQDNFNRTPLHFAASNGNFNTVKLLVQSRVIIDVVDKYGITPLMWAVYNNHKKVVIYLIENGAKYTRVTKQGHTIFHFIAESNAIGILKYLYQKFHVLKIDQEDHSGMTPYLVAAQRGNLLLMEVFVKQGCSVKKKNKCLRSALHLAAWKGHANVVDFLLKMEVMLQLINDVDSEGKSALHLAAESNHKEIMSLLLKGGANPDITSDTQDCPLIESARTGFHACIDVLLIYGADKDMRSQDGSTAVHVAALANLPETVYHLLGRGCDLHSTNDRGQTPLHLAVEQNKLETVEALLLAGAELDLKDQDDKTPLDVAARASYIALADLIIKTERWREKYPHKAKAIRKRLLTLGNELPEYNPSINAGHETTSVYSRDRSTYSSNHDVNSDYDPTYDRVSQAHSENSVRTQTLANSTAANHERSAMSRNTGHDATSIHENSIYDRLYERMSQAPTESSGGLPGAYENRKPDHDPDKESVNTLIPDESGRMSHISSKPGSKKESNVHTLRPPESQINSHISSNGASKISTHAVESTWSDYHKQLPSGFIDPFTLIPPDEELPQENQEPSVYKTGSEAPSDELSLGYEAANAWGRASTVSNRPSQQYEQIYNTPIDLEQGESEYERSSEQTPIQGDFVTTERRLSNGELIVSIVDPAKYNDADSTMSGSIEEEFTLLKYPQACAEKMKVIFFELSHKYLKPEDWIKLAKYWEFKQEHIEAIQLQETGKYSYRDHGYRSLGIWLFNVEVDRSPIDELYRSLIGIHRLKLARKLRSKIEKKEKRNKCKIH